MPNPERIVFALPYRLEFERNGRVPRRDNAVKDGCDVVASVDVGYHQKAHLIDEIRLEEHPIGMAASFEE
jgi:hypothetical protein